MPNTAARSDGFYTVGMQDYQFDLPTSTVMLGCAAKCDDTIYPEPKPKSELDLVRQHS